MGKMTRMRTILALLVLVLLSADAVAYPRQTYPARGDYWARFRENGTIEEEVSMVLENHGAAVAATESEFQRLPEDDGLTSLDALRTLIARHDIQLMSFAILYGANLTRASIANDLDAIQNARAMARAISRGLDRMALLYEMEAKQMELQEPSRGIARFMAVFRRNPRSAFSNLFKTADELKDEYVARNRAERTGVVEMLLKEYWWPSRIQESGIERWLYRGVDEEINQVASCSAVLSP